MTRARAAVTGLGAVSGFGEGVAALWDGLVAGRRAVAVRPELRAQGLDVGPVALVPGDAAAANDARALDLALAAAQEAVRSAGLTAPSPNRGRWAVVCGTTLGGIDSWLRALATGEASRAQSWGWAAPAHAVARELGARGPVETTPAACASSNVALGVALDLLREGACDVAIAGGVDALNPFVLSGFAALKALDLEPCRPFARGRRGLNLGEGAGFLVLETEAHARGRGAGVRAFLDGWGASADAVHMTGPDRDGAGCALAMARALADAGAAASELGFVSAHGTATPFNDRMEAQALARLYGTPAPAVPVNSIKGALGHTLGAAGALEAILCVRALETGLIPPTAGEGETDPEIALDVVRGAARKVPLRAALSTSSGFGGVNAALVFRAPG